MGAAAPGPDDLLLGGGQAQAGTAKVGGKAAMFVEGGGEFLAAGNDVVVAHAVAPFGWVTGEAVSWDMSWPQ